MTLMKCEHCGAVFDEDEVKRFPEYVDDSGIVAYYTLCCPFCNSDEIDNYYESGEEE